MPGKLNPDYRDMICALNDAKVEYLLVGAYAVAVHAVARATYDIDFWVRPCGENAPRTMAALVSFGAPLFDLTMEDLAKPGTIFQIGREFGGIHFMTAVDGVSFDHAWPHRVITRIENFDVPVIGLDDLIANKTQTGRNKDQIDVLWLKEKKQSGTP